MDIIDERKIFLQELVHPRFRVNNISVSVLRLDLIHPVISGNKWFKLKENIRAGMDGSFGQLLTFGGAYSNHLIATAAAANQAGLKSVGIVRGLHGAVHETETLKHCREYGMQLHFISREDYDRKNDPQFLNRLEEQFGKSFIISEGGANEYGIRGAAEIAKFIPVDTTDVCVSAGTATTFIGLRNTLPVHTFLHGFAPLKGGNYLADFIRAHVIAPDTNWTLTDEYHFGGFGKTTAELLAFIEEMMEHDLPLDKVYTAKMMMGIRDLISKNYFKPGSRITAIHTGGLQGN